MLVIDDVRTGDVKFPYLVLTIGSFDGIHRGHQIVLKAVVDAARKAGGTAAVLTFRPHPRQYFSPAHAPNLLTTDAKKVALFDLYGIDVVFILPFDADSANLAPRGFVGQILDARCGVKELIVGHDFRFGKGAEGNFEMLETIAPEYGMRVREVAPLLLNGERVSSTLVRECVLQGDLERVEDLLGRKYSIVGEVVTGRGLGATLGFPTANIRPQHSAVPAHGVYVAEALVGAEIFAAAVNIGIAPTIRHDDTTIEAFLLDFDRDIVGAPIELVFHRRLRPERKFPSRDALVRQISRDVDIVREYFVRRDQTAPSRG